MDEIVFVYTNHGLIRADKLTMTLPTNHPFLRFELVSDGSQSLDNISVNANSSLSLTVKITDISVSSVRRNAYTLASVEQEAAQRARQELELVEDDIDEYPRARRHAHTISRRGSSCYGLGAGYVYRCGDKNRGVWRLVDPLVLQFWAVGCAHGLSCL